ncbi:hypothetical protein [Hoeflea prorocentri]|uniref:Lipoprotein n=1 Tax=Hoeflea prorocentri TaxID=1922333 RepID=A0A9X3UGE2_9HYPH|nr:hypothetical protein [Hoeflea prorocentri]MCY6380365.1 hypothetical protein [Hoeflea prorocentri]MDA5398165.1 hypothetical protein [Hoeflea prorocentri]
MTLTPRRLLIALPVLTAALAACQTSGSGPGNISVSSQDAALPTMERIALAANKCWFKGADRAFRAYRLAPELNSFSGRPRILIVPGGRPQDRPLAVIEAQGTPATVSAYGPLMSQSAGNRIAADTRRWAGGGSSC